ncbi:hypothetical protein ABVT39_001072 [Epinephelus coioides]
MQQRNAVLNGVPVPSVAVCTLDDLVSLLQSVNVRRHWLENEKHPCSAVSRKSGEVLKGTGLIGVKKYKLVDNQELVFN